MLDEAAWEFCAEDIVAIRTEEVHIWRTSQVHTTTATGLRHQSCCNPFDCEFGRGALRQGSVPKLYRCDGNMQRACLQVDMTLSADELQALSHVFIIGTSLEARHKTVKATLGGAHKQIPQQSLMELESAKQAMNVHSDDAAAANLRKGGKLRALTSGAPFLQ